MHPIYGGQLTLCTGMAGVQKGGCFLEVWGATKGNETFEFEVMLAGGAQPGQIRDLLMRNFISRGFIAEKQGTDRLSITGLAVLGATKSLEKYPDKACFVKVGCGLLFPAGKKADCERTIVSCLSTVFRSRKPDDQYGPSYDGGLQASFNSTNISTPVKAGADKKAAAEAFVIALRAAGAKANLRPASHDEFDVELVEDPAGMPFLFGNISIETQNIGVGLRFSKPVEDDHEQTEDSELAAVA